MQYWIRLGTNEQGPFTPKQLREFAALGKLAKGCQLSADRKKWTEIEKIKGLPTATIEKRNPVDVENCDTSPNKAKVEVFRSGDFSVVVDPDEHTVAQPSDAANTHVLDAFNRKEDGPWGVVLGSAFGFCFCFAALVLLLCVIAGILPVAPSRGLGAAILFGLLIYLPGTLLCLAGLIVFAIKFFAADLPKMADLPARGSPSDTLKTFFDSIDRHFWRRAYSCLTDTARVETESMPRHTAIQQAMPRQNYSSALSQFQKFKRFWTDLPFTYTPAVASIRQVRVRPDVVGLVLPIEITLKNGEMHRISSKFVALKQGDYWFLCNGFIWPPGEPEKTAPIVCPNGHGELNVGQLRCETCGWPDVNGQIHEKECPRGHGALREFNGRPRCWKCGWPEK